MKFWAFSSKSIEKAICLLVNQFQKSGTNSKPVILHSIRVAFHLAEKEYGTEEVIAGVLHDIIEDTTVKPSEIEKKFGKRIRKLIQAVSYDTSIPDKKKRENEMLSRSVRKKESARIKCVDIYDNSFYIERVKGLKKQKYLIKKIENFLKMSKSVIGSEEIWKKLQKKMREEKTRLL